jgi:acetyl/propionyl-CoA carboxylase alpha subunit
MHIGYRSGGRQVGITVHRDGPGRFTVGVDETPHIVEAALLDPLTIQIVIGGVSQVAHVVRIGGVTHVWLAGEVYQLQPETAGSAGAHAVHLQPQVVAPMPGKVLQVLVEAGQTVATGDGLIIVEAMKMEHRIVAEGEAVVRAVHAVAGQMVDGGAVLVELEYVSAGVAARPPEAR